MQTVRLSVAFNEDSLANDKKVAERRGRWENSVARGDVYAPPVHFDYAPEPRAMDLPSAKHT